VWQNFSLLFDAIEFDSEKYLCYALYVKLELCL